MARREVTYYCVGPDCDTHQTSAQQYAPLVGWLLVTLDDDPSTPMDQLDFCSWNCCMRYAARMPPPEMIGDIE